MRLALVLIAVVAALIVGGAALAHLAIAPGLFGGLLLLIALFLPRKPKCTGMHCAGCRDDH